MEHNNITLYTWAYKNGLDCNVSDDNLKELFIPMDKALRYLHENNCVVDSFNPYDIQLVNGDINNVFFTRFSPIQNPFNKDNLIKDNLFKESCLHVGLFTNTLANLDIDFLKSNFDSFAENIPGDLVPYYKGVICRNASVYLCDFLNEKRIRDLNSLQKELESEDQHIDITKNNVDFTNRELNDKLYSDVLSKKKIGKYNDYGMVNIMLVTIIVLTIVLIVSILMLFFL